MECDPDCQARAARRTGRTLAAGGPAGQFYDVSLSTLSMSSFRPVTPSSE